MSENSPGEQPVSAAAPASEQAASPVFMPHGLLKREDGVFFDVSVSPSACVAAANHVFLSDAYFAGIDYPAFMRALYHYGPDVAPVPDPSGASLLRVADDIVPFAAARRKLYKVVKLRDGIADYYFEALYAEESGDPGAPPQATKLDFGEFVAFMWHKGVRFGIDVATVQAYIASGKLERVSVARRLEAGPAQDACIIEVTQDIRRNDAPREKADGRVDLLTFQNRFPQIKERTRLLQKLPGAPGAPGYELSGLALQPAPPQDVALDGLAGPGTALEQGPDGEFLVATETGFLSVDGDSGRISVSSKIVSRDGVSGRTTGNLRLNAGYEEFGEVQEQRLVEGSDITIHGDVFGKLHSHGGAVLLSSNLVGGSVLNDCGEIRIKGVASGALLQAQDGDVFVERAESCVISGTRVVIGHASNCEIIADEVNIVFAEGCAIAARSIDIESAGPRKQSEMLLYVLLPDLTRIDQQIAALEASAEQLAQAVARRVREIDSLTNLPDVRQYVLLAQKVRKNEIVLKPEQVPEFQKMATGVGPALRAIGKLSLDSKETEQKRLIVLEQAGALAEQKKALAAQSRCNIKMITGDIVLRGRPGSQDAAALRDKTAKEIKAGLRGADAGATAIFAGSGGALDWAFDPARRQDDFLL